MEHATLSDTASSNAPSDGDVARKKALRDARVRALLAGRMTAKCLSTAFAAVLQQSDEG